MWREIDAKWELRPDEARLLEDACREVDLIDRLEAALVDAPLMVTGSQGQLVASPLVQELRQHRQTLKTLLGALDLPEPGEVAGNRSTQARAAAMARWATPARRKGVAHG